MSWTLTHDPAIVPGGSFGGLVWWEAELVNALGQQRLMRITADDQAQACVTAERWRDWCNARGATPPQAFDGLDQSGASAALLSDSRIPLPAFLRRQAD